jgi:hypothetical protein
MGRRWLILCWSILLLLAAGLVLPGVEAQTRHHAGDVPGPGV